MPELPERAYLVTVDGEWPINVVVDDGQLSSVLGKIEDAIRIRKKNGGSSRLHVWKMDLVNPRECDFTPPKLLPAELHERNPDA